MVYVRDEPLDLTTREDRRFLRRLREGVLRNSWLAPVFKEELTKIKESGQDIRAMAAGSLGLEANRQIRRSTIGAR